MSFLVKEIDPSSELGKLIEPRKGSNDSGQSTQIRIKKLNGDKLGVVIQQTGRNGYIVYEGNDLLETKKAFLQLQQAISLLHVSNVILLSVELLEPLILPEPIQDKDTLLERLINEADTSHDKHEALCPIIESLLNERPATLNGQAKKENIILTEEDEEEYAFGEKIVSFVTLGFDSLTNDLSSLFHELGDELASKINSKVCSLDDDELGEKIWESYLTKVKNMTTNPNLEGKSIAASAFDVSDDEDICLILAVKNGYVNTAMHLLLQGNDPNEIVPSVGTTALHMAVMKNREVMVKLLLIFNADPTIKNTKGKSSIDLAKEGSDIFDHLIKAKNAQEKTRKYFDSHSSLSPPSEKGTYLLSLDGGGIRAFNICQYMIAVEDRIKKLSPNADTKPFSSYFDYIAGTSSGAISALVMLYTNHSLRTGRYLSFEIVSKVFRKGLNHRERLMKEYLHNLFGTEKVMADLQGQRVIITGTLANREPIQLHLMTNYGEARDGQLGPEKRKVWEAACISSSAPFYFPAFEDMLLDGGLIANNPTLAAMTEIIEQKEDVNFGYILSLGSGCLPESKPVTNVNFFVPGFSFKTLLEIPNAMKGLKNLFDLFIDQVTQSDGQCVKQAEAWSKNSGWKHIRWTPPLYGLSEDVDPTATDNEIIIDMLYHTQLYILDNPESVDDTAKHLLAK